MFGSFEEMINCLSDLLLKLFRLLVKTFNQEFFKLTINMIQDMISEVLNFMLF